MYKYDTILKPSLLNLEDCYVAQMLSYIQTIKLKHKPFSKEVKNTFKQQKKTMKIRLPSIAGHLEIFYFVEQEETLRQFTNCQRLFTTTSETFFCRKQNGRHLRSEGI